MYQNKGSLTLRCGNTDVLYQDMKLTQLIGAVQLPLMNGGYYSRLLGAKYSELVFEGSFIPSDKLRYDAFIGIVSGAAVTLTADSVTYTGCTLVEYELSQQPDSRLYRFRMKFRRY